MNLVTSVKGSTTSSASSRSALVANTPGQRAKHGSTQTRPAAASTNLKIGNGAKTAAPRMATATNLITVRSADSLGLLAAEPATRLAPAAVKRRQSLARAALRKMIRAARDDSHL